MLMEREDQEDAGKFHGNPNDTLGIFPSLYFYIFYFHSGALVEETL